MDGLPRPHETHRHRPDLQRIPAPGALSGESAGTSPRGVLVVDCFSTDDTREIARAQGARVIQHDWVNHATQFNWALTQLDPDTDWVLRLDADDI